MAKKKWDQAEYEKREREWDKKLREESPEAGLFMDVSDAINKGDMDYPTARNETKDESLFVSILLFPFRLPILIIKGIFALICGIISIILNIGKAGLSTIIGVPFAILVLCLTVFIGIPLRIVFFIITFGNVILWEDEMFDWFINIKDWVFEAWEF